MRSFLNQVEVKKDQNKIRIKDLAHKIKKTGETPTLFSLNEFDFPIVSGLLSTRELFAASLGINPSNIIKHISEKINHPRNYKIVKKADFLEDTIEIDENTNLDGLIPLIDFYGGKRYTTSTIVGAIIPSEERQNISFHRMMYLGKNQFAIRIVAQRHLDKAYTEKINNNEELDIAIIVGVHPAIEISASFSVPNLDEYKLASAFLDGLELYKLPNGILVPKDSEFVMEGKITNGLAKEGPFIDLTGTADIVRQQPILKVNRLYHKTNPIFRTILPSGKEHKILMGIPQEPRIYNYLSNTISTIKNVVLTQGGCSWLHAIVQIQKKTEGDPKNAILAALAAHPSLKRVVVVDEDIDINNAEDVEWAIATRVQADKDILMVPNSKGSSLDPSSNDSITCKWGIDATKPLKDNEEYNKVEF
ncbi:MAG: UbiD family decarboxylase [Candidatus Lokiarchaeota archaeon]|nr:UbiD family decarboxylase [Candidatus Lokiarchaeota archaeon]MBD3342921.1 UbiD family decarboxylase [Candidatus Lokiarchaeota archaeon]